MIWYQYQLSLDEKDQFEMLRDVAEHNAMFMNPEAVQQIRDARNNTYETPEEDFHDMLKEQFGRELPNVSKEDRISAIDVLKQQVEHSKKINPYMDMELDEVSFIPFK